MAEDVVEEEEEEGQEKIDLQQMANEALAGRVLEFPKEKRRRSTIPSDGNYSDEGGNGKGRGKTKSGNGKEEQGKQQEDIEEKKKIVYLQKYYSNEGVLAEAILIGGKPCFLISRKEKLSCIEIQASIELDDEILKPCELSSYINLPYGFGSEVDLKECIQRSKEQTLDSLYRKNKTIWRKYVDGDDFHISIAAADEIYSYFQEKIGLTHYLFFTGGNNSGKSNNLSKIHYTAYRNMMSTDMTAPNIYQFLGGREDEGHGTICEDEADNIDESPDKMRIYKNGYTTGFPVLRTDTSLGRKQQRFNTFCFKAFAAERTPDPEKAKGFIQRIVEVNCFAGNPPCDISEVVNPAGDQENQNLLDELLEYRNILLIYKLLHFHEPIQDIKDLNIKNREKQLFKPLIRLFQNEECLGEILKVISEYISKKRAASVDSLHAYLYRTMKEMMINKNTTEFESSVIWQTIKDDLRGGDVKGKPMSYDTEDFGILSQKKIIGILKDVFGAEHPRHTGATKKLIFNKSKFDRLDNVYNLELKINVGRGHDNGSSGENSIGLDKHMSIETASEDDNTSGTSTTTFDLDESDVDDVDGIEPNTIVSDVKESIQIQKQNNELYNIYQHNDEKIVSKNKTSNGLSSNDPLDPTHPTQQDQEVMNNKSPKIQVQNSTSVDTGDIGDIIVQPSQKDGLYDNDYVYTMPSLQSPKPVVQVRSNDDIVNPLKEGKINSTESPSSHIGGKVELHYQCYYCNSFKTNSKDDYESHVINKHGLGHPCYPCKADLERLGLKVQGKSWEM